ncbi:MAG: serine/threonine-protein kinase [Polyangiaceae bacterium]
MTDDPRTIGDYRLVASLGSGGMARVFLAISQRTGGFQKLLVIKTLRTEIAEDPEFRRMFLDEARVAARLNHPNVVHTYEVGEDPDGRIFIAMEYLEGQAFSSVLTRVGRDVLSLAVGLRVLADALAGLHYAHELCDFDGRPLGLVHRDVSPQNVFVLYGGFSKILDFGIAKGTLSVGETKSGVIKGKAGYMAPEQVTGGAIDRRADVFAVGVMLWELLAQKRLVARTDDEVAVLARRMHGKDPKIRDVAKDAPEELLVICERAMALAADDRFPTAAAMQEAIEGYLAKVGGGDARAVAACLESPFKDDRSKVRRVVEEGMRALETSGSIPSLRVSQASTSGVGSGAGATSASGSGSRPGPTSVEPTGPTSAAAPIAGTVPPEAEKKKPWALVGGAVGVLAVVAALVVLAGRVTGTKAPVVEEPKPSASPSLATKEPAAPPPSAAPSAEKGFRTKIATVPKGALVFVDGVPATNPFEGELDAGAHKVRVQASGFRTAERTISASDGPEILVTLEALPQGQAEAPSLPTGRPKKPKRDIDDTDPYK